MSCLDNIISVRDVCNNEEESSLSGLDLMDAPEISTKNLANIANEEYVSGLALARKKAALATTFVRNDMMSILAASNYIPDIVTREFVSGTYNNNNIFYGENKERGLKLFKNKSYRGTMRKTVIDKIMVYPQNNIAEATLNIYDDYGGGISKTYTVELIAGEENVFEVNYEVKGDTAVVVLDGNGVNVYSTPLECMTGCNGSMPNECGYVAGFYNGKVMNGKDGYGINIMFRCYCDFDGFLCGLATGYIGEIVWLKARVLLMEEHLRTNRLNNWVVYGRDETKDYLNDIENQYRMKWNGLVDAMPNILKSYRDDCFDCRKTKLVVNVG